MYWRYCTDRLGEYFRSVPFKDTLGLLSLKQSAVIYSMQCCESNYFYLGIDFRSSFYPPPSKRRHLVRH